MYLERGFCESCRYLDVFVAFGEGLCAFGGNAARIWGFGIDALFVGADSSSGAESWSCGDGSSNGSFCGDGGNGGIEGGMNG